MASISIREAEAADRERWIAMRTALWPDDPEEHAAIADAYFDGGTPFVHRLYVAAKTGHTGTGALVGFVELRLRDYADGSDEVGVPYVEGWYVDDAWRGRGVGRQLIQAAEAWALSLGKTELASDVELDNTRSLAAHAALGFEETGRLVTFLKRIEPANTSRFRGSDSADGPVRG